ncbi:MAG: flippase-like domain-containing protein [Coriobacteriia bacterium]|nr:flippase-like domain-containing protein [Coriobacteriia bacterium]
MALASALLFAALAALTETVAVIDALRTFPVHVFVVLLLATTAGIGVRAVRWRRLMGLLGFPVSFAQALHMQLAGQAAAVTPGRVGEVLKPWFAREVAEMPFSRGVALVFVERIADLVAVCLLGLGALSIVGGGWVTLIALASALAAVVVGARSGRLHAFGLALASRHRLLRDHQVSMERVAETLRMGLSGPVLARSVAAAVLVWGVEGLAFAWCLYALGFTTLLAPAAVSVHALSVLAGALSFLPGGIGLTEATMAGMLVGAGMATAAASAATIIVRVATLWWGVALGWAALASRPRLLRQLFAGGAVGGGDQASRADMERSGGYNGADD